MTTAILLVLLGLAGLTLGGELLVRGAVGIAQRMGLSQLFTGLVIVGSATSMPEMVTSIEAALAGSPGIAWGNIIGSNVANTLLILGAAALVAPIVLTGTGKRDAVVALVATCLIWLIAFQGLASPWIGAALLALLTVYIIWRYRHPRAGEGDDEEEPETPPLLWPAIGLFVAGVAILVFGGQMLVTGAIDIARFAGLSETVIGLTIVAVGTSLPELAASVAAALRGKSAMAIGNVVGSNIYNLLLIGGVTMTIAPLAIPPELNDLEWPLVALSAVMMVVLCSYARKIERWFGGLLLAAFVAFNVMLFV
ncbi:calcium/sodium antiporter [Pontixanthobacter gangjinensis]|uniref:Calcium/sodium antiporter n=1 Tax=Pontixanthobacter gangjinensis TaxID=1028742 RepID=A0A6I4SQU9_9SPHN|nr:calcium/sodium antiporter [Pontixanthobacter gangjinensis]MXO57530.1 calcium/sodium antiporter [Pontixanthobacter gangjinensis]